MNIPENGFYVHYKHEPNAESHNYMYEVVGLARNTEDKSYAVLYRPLYKNDWFAPASYQARPLDMFVEEIEKDGSCIPRFRKVSDPELVSELEKVRASMYNK